MTRIPLAFCATLALLTACPAAGAVAPSCAEGPQIVGDTYYGTPCDDTIRAPRNVTTVYGEGGNDTIYGQRGNDTLYGGPGDDRLYGGVGDDELRGGPGDDLLSGGFGADNLDGEEGSDFVRGDATIDRLGDSGTSGNDTLSFATGTTPGFPNSGDLGYEGFPEEAEGRGVFVDLSQGFANDGLAPSGGGVDEPLGASNFESFETVIGTAFSDMIVGSSAAQTIYGGGGADVILGKGGGDHVFGGAGGDYCESTEASISECEFSGSEHEVGTRNPGSLEVGVLAPQEGEPAALYLTGSDGEDSVVASYSGGVLTIANHGTTVGSFPLAEPPDTLLLAGLAGGDTLSATNLPAVTSVVLLGNEGDDALTGGETEDALIDGAGNDVVQAGGGDDAVPNNGGADQLHAGAGEDLFISNAICEGDLLDGGPDRDNANWANFGAAVSIDLESGHAGLVGEGGRPSCPSGSLTSLSGLEDIEGSSYDDVMVGSSGSNQLLGRSGQDTYSAGAGDDSILANSGDSDLAIECGEGWDTVLIDIPTSSYADPAPVACEDIEERPVNSFRPPGTPPGPEPEAQASSSPAPPAAKPKPDRVAPRTRLSQRPGHLVFTRSRRRTVAFAFASNEPGSTFRCRLDRRPPARCASPRRFRVAAGRHVLRVHAVDPAGNADPTPIAYSFRVVRLRFRAHRSHRR